MKNVLTITAALVLMAGSAQAMAIPAKTETLSIADERTEPQSPFIRKEGNKLFLNYLNLEAKKVTIKVYDSSNRLLYIEKMDEDLVVEKAFNFEKAYEGTYSLVVSYGNKTIKESLRVLR